VVLVAAGLISAGGLIALAVEKIRAKTSAKKILTPPNPKENAS
jgi:hypothetical protein